MTRIRGYGFTRKDKVFAEFETDSGKYLFKESHSSKKGIYNIGIYNPAGDKVYNIKMNREQMNRIKTGSGISRIDFLSEEGFNNYIKAQYINRDFDEQSFKDFFKYHFVREYEGLNNEYYYYYTGKNGEEGTRIEGVIDEYYIQYMAYLVDKSPNFVLENIYNERPDMFIKTFHYTDVDYEKAYLQDNAKGYGYRFQFLDKARAEILQNLNARGVNYLSYDEFVKQGLYENYKSVPRSPLDENHR